MASYHLKYVLEYPVSRTTTGRLLHLLIANYCDSTGRLAFTYEDMATMMACTPPTIRTAVEELIQKGAIKRSTSTNRRTHSYQMLDYINEKNVN